MNSNGRPICTRFTGRLAAVAVAATLSACGGDGSTGPTGPIGLAGKSTLATVSIEPIGANCSTGGTRVVSGLDVDSNGTLDTREQTNVQFVCNGAAGANGPAGGTGTTGPTGPTGATGPIGSAGANGPNGADGSNGQSAMISLVGEAAGVNCPSGGTRVTAGLDADGNGVLDASEVKSTTYVCVGPDGATGAAGPTGSNGSDGNVGATGATGAVGATGAAGSVGATGPAGNTGVTGATGPAGATGAAGPVGATGPVGSAGATGTTGVNARNSLLLLTVEPAGANCQYGGRRVQSGVDTNGNGALDAAEVTQTGYVCGGTPAPLAVQVNVTGTATAASPNVGYVANNAAQVVVTLPVAPLVGDVVSVSAAGAGGWRVAQNAGQAIVVGGLPATVISGNIAGVFKLKTVPTAGALSPPQYLGAVRSLDGRNLFTVENEGRILGSNDGGATWTARGPGGTPYWTGIYSNDAQNQIVAVPQSGGFSISTDGGATFTTHGPTFVGWISFALSEGGTRMVAGTNRGSAWYSSDSGINWTASAGTSAFYFEAVAMSTDGSKVVAGDRVGSQALYRSTDGGATYTTLAAAGAHDWTYAASSGDGQTLLAFGQDTSRLYQSTDGGTTWAAIGPSMSGASGVAMSADASKIVVTRYNATTLVSTDGGASFLNGAQVYPSGFLGPLAMSRDGLHVSQAVYNPSFVGTSDVTTTTVGTTGSLTGLQYDAVTLQYLGAGLFVPIDFSSFSGAYTVR